MTKEQTFEKMLAETRNVDLINAYADMKEEIQNIVEVEIAELEKAVDGEIARMDEILKKMK